MYVDRQKNAREGLLTVDRAKFWPGVSFSHRSMKGSGNFSISLVDLFVLKIQLRECERVVRVDFLNKK
jgi:hypothetical protein